MEENQAMDDTDLGTLTRQGDRWTLRFTRRLTGQASRSWQTRHLPLYMP